MTRRASPWPSRAATSVTVLKKKGKLGNLEASLNGLGRASGAVIAHTRWATHGRPNDVNAHPHCDCTGKIALIHNGIIENYLPLKERLIAQGHVFSSDTDTEVLVHLVEAHLASLGSLEQAVRAALAEVTGAYAICVVSSRRAGRHLRRQDRLAADHRAGRGRELPGLGHPGHDGVYARRAGAGRRRLCPDDARRRHADDAGRAPAAPGRLPRHLGRLHGPEGWLSPTTC